MNCELVLSLRSRSFHKRAVAVPNNELQSKRFNESPKQLEADESFRSFDDAFSIVASSIQSTGLPSPKDKA